LSSPETRPLGFYHNFERCIAMAPEAAEFVALADHDDFWHRDKLETLLAAFNPDTTLVYSDMRIITPDQRVLANTYWTTRDNNHTNFASLLMANSITGAVSLFRRALLPDLLPFPQRIGDSFHDHWIGCVAMALGKVGYVPRPLHDYVQHRGQVIGHFVPSGSRLSRWLGALARINPRNARSLAQAYLNHGSLVYFNDAARIEAIARTLDLRCGYRLSDDRRKVIQRFEQILGGASWLWLTTRGMNPKRAAETVGAEHYLMRGFTWRACSIETAPAADAQATCQRHAATNCGAVRACPGHRVPATGAGQFGRRSAQSTWISGHRAGRINLIISIDLKHLFGGYIGKLNRPAARPSADIGCASFWSTIATTCPRCGDPDPQIPGAEHLFERVELRINSIEVFRCPSARETASSRPPGGRPTSPTMPAASSDPIASCI
jgi:hypothetical protein